MPATDRVRVKGRREGGSFARMPHDIFRGSPEHPAPASRLSKAALALLLDLAMQYSGRNNGNICASHAVMKRLAPERWSSAGTLDSALVELVAEGFLEQTRQGGRNVASLYALTWQAVDQGPHHAKPTTIASQLWKPEHRDRRDQGFRARWEARQQRRAK